MKIAEVRLKAFVPGLTAAGNQVIRSADTEMHLDEAGGLLFVKHLKTKKEFIIHVSSVDYLLPEVPKPLPSPKLDIPVEDPHPTPTDHIVTSVADDTVRMVKIKGKVVERKGAPKDDELDELTKPRKTVAEMIAEAEEEG